MKNTLTHKFCQHAMPQAPSPHANTLHRCGQSFLRAAVLCALGAAASVHAASLVVTVIDKDGKPTPDAVVIVMPSTKAAAKSPPPMLAVINQEKMQFIPALTVVSPGAKIRFTNSDAWDHHVRMAAPGLSLPTDAATTSATSTANGFALRLEGKTEGKPAKSVEVTLDNRPGALGASLLGCFIHGSMSGAVYVADSPWTLKTGADGTATLDDLPEGTAAVKVWHAAQPVDLKPQSITLGATPGKLTMQLDVVPRRRRAS
jgi:plastocyanin